MDFMKSCAQYHFDNEGTLLHLQHYSMYGCGVRIYYKEAIVYSVFTVFTLFTLLVKL